MVLEFVVEKDVEVGEGRILVGFDKGFEGNDIG